VRKPEEKKKSRFTAFGRRVAEGRNGNQDREGGTHLRTLRGKKTKSARRSEITHNRS